MWEKEDALRQNGEEGRKEVCCGAVVNETADMTVLCASGNKSGWQRGSWGDGGPAGGAAQKTL